MAAVPSAPALDVQATGPRLCSKVMRFVLRVASAFFVASGVARAAPSVWVVDDGEKIRQDDTSSPFERGDQNPVWRPGEPVRLFAMRNESVAVQVVVEADTSPLDSVSVDLVELDGPGGAQMLDDPCGSPAAPGAIERFVEHFVLVRRASGGRTAGESLGWVEGSGPTPGRWTGHVPDALVPVCVAARWVPYPLRIEPRQNGIVWIDLNVPRHAPPGLYAGAILVQNDGRRLAALPVELTVVDAALPDRTVDAALYYDPAELERRVGGAAERQAWALLHAHRIAPLHDAISEADVWRQRGALDGTLYTLDHGYAGPAPAQGDPVLSLGAYGAFGDPSDATQLEVTRIARAIAAAKLFEKTEVFLYADDERCSSTRGVRWSEWLRSARDEDLRRVRVAWTCSRDPASQPVDIAIVDSAHYLPTDGARNDASDAKRSRAWVYNGVLPYSGTFLLDADAVSPRVNGWLSAMFHVPRWFYWEATYWYGKRGQAPLDPFAEPESFHNEDGDWANGDGVLLYPGRQIDHFADHSLGFDGVIASIRLKNWRRGIEDAGYLELARAADRERADAIARALIPAAFGAAVPGAAPSWGARGAPFFAARRALLDVVLGRTAAAHDAIPRPRDRGAPSRVPSSRTALALAATLALLAAGITRRRNVDRGARRTRDGSRDAANDRRP